MVQEVRAEHAADRAARADERDSERGASAVKASVAATPQSR